MHKPDASAAIGLLLFILVIVGATTAIIWYKKYDLTTVLVWSIVGIAVLFVIGMLFTGIRVPGTKPIRIAEKLGLRLQKKACILFIK